MWIKSSFAIPAVAATSFCLIGGTSPAVADILHVPGDFPTIQEAIDAAVDGDEVEVHPGTYNETINFLGKAITVRSSDGPEITIIDAQQTGTVVTCTNGEGPNTVLDGFTITGGSANSGGGMYNDNSSPTVTNCTFTANSALVGQFAYGGGMYNNFLSSPTVSNCTFSGNSADDRGGGMYNDKSSPTVTNCTFSGNMAPVGGGMSNSNNSSRPTVTNCTFSGNAASIAGGGMYNSNGASPSVTDCSFTANLADFGGGMYNGSSSPTVTNCIFSENSAGFGGGMYNAYGMPTVTNCTFAANAMTGMVNEDSPPSVTGCKFIDNGAFAASGGLDSGGMTNFGTFNGSTVVNCTFVGNSVGIFTHVRYNGLVVFNCIVWANVGGEISGGAETVAFSNVEGGFPGVGNIDADPLFVDPGNGDLHLSPGSPCIDAADNTAVPKGIDTDLDGEPRFVDDPCTDDTGNGDPPIVDMGAYEFQALPCPWDLDANGSVGASDLLSLLVSWGPCKGCPADFDGDGTVGASDLLTLLVNWGPCP